MESSDWFVTGGLQLPTVRGSIQGSGRLRHRTVLYIFYYLWYMVFHFSSIYFMLEWYHGASCRFFSCSIKSIPFSRLGLSLP